MNRAVEKDIKPPQTLPIPHNRPTLDDEDARAAFVAVMSGWVASGERVKSLENKISQMILGRDNAAVAVSSGTAALYLALHLAGVKTGDEVIIPDYVCSAVLNAVYMAGAKPIIADIDPDTLALSRETATTRMTKKTRAIIAVHPYGLHCEIKDLKSLNVPIIEDCAAGLGSKFLDGQPLGSQGDIAVFSFYATKMIAAGYGGALVSANEKIIARARDYINFDKPDRYYPRFNFLLSDINAAVALSQLQKIDQFISRRREIAALYRRSIGKSFCLRYARGDNNFNFYRFLLYLSHPDELCDFRHHLDNLGIKSIIPLEVDELLHGYLGMDDRKFPVSTEMATRLLSIPVFPGLSDEEVNYIGRIIGQWKFKY